MRRSPKIQDQNLPSQKFNTIFVLMAQYGATAVIPLEYVCRDYFRHINPKNFEQKALEGKIALPIVRMVTTERSAKGVPLLDLARWIDERIEAARVEMRALCDLD